MNETGARRGVRLAMAALVLTGQVGPLAAQPAPPADETAPAAAGSRQDYEACLGRDDAAFRAGIEKVTVKALAAATRGLDYKAIIAEEWRKGGIDALMAARVDASLASLKEETSWRELLSSLAYKATQEKLARAAAERVYNASDIKGALETVADGVGREVGRRLDFATVDAAEQASQCLKSYLRARYGETVAQVITRDARAKTEIDAGKGAASVSSTKILIKGQEGIAGLVIIIMRRQLANMAERVGARLVGAVLGRVVSVVAGGIGVVLIAKDLWDLRSGVLPIIGNEMKSPATRDKVQAELASALSTEIDKNVSELARRTSDSVLETLAENRRAHAKVLELAERLPDFRRFLEGVSPQKLSRLDEIVALELASGAGEPGLVARVADGSLGEAVEHWPDAALQIARDQRSLEAGLKWRALAGDALLPKLVEYEVYRRAAPEAMTRAGLTRLLGLEDRTAITRLASLKAGSLDRLLELGDDDLRRLGRGLGEAELQSLSGYLDTLDKPAGQRLLRAVAEQPKRMTALASEGVRAAVLASRDQGAALAVMLRAGDLPDVGEFLQDFNQVRSGAISPRVLAARYPSALIALGVAALALLLLVWRAIAGRRPRRSSGAAAP